MMKTDVGQHVFSAVAQAFSLWVFRAARARERCGCQGRSKRRLLILNRARQPADLGLFH
jgi:hypothetical protein